MAHMIKCPMQGSARTCGSLGTSFSYSIGGLLSALSLTEFSSPAAVPLSSSFPRSLFIRIKESNEVFVMCVRRCHESTQYVQLAS